MKICCISDTHEMERRIEIPPCDLLLHAGDFTFRGDPDRIQDFSDWCASLISRGVAGRIVTIAGNHDLLFESCPEAARACLQHLDYLEDSEIEIEGLRIYGTPWQPWFFDWAFNLKSEKLLKEKFDLIPAGTDILICHSPPIGILSSNYLNEDCGSSSLLEAIQRVRPRLVVFGHIHEGYGSLIQDGIHFVNASICNVNYEPVNPPILIDF